MKVCIALYACWIHLDSGTSIHPKPMIAYSPYFSKIYKFPVHYLHSFSFLATSYFDHDAFTHHALHVLDAPFSIRAKELTAELVYFIFFCGIAWCLGKN